MRADEGRGSQVDVRARRAARGSRLVVSQLQPHAPADLERFNRFRHRRQRNERYKVFAVAAVVSLLVAIILARWLPLRERAPARPVPDRTNGLIVFGRSSQGLDQRSLFTVAPDGTGEQRLPTSYTDCGEWSPDGSRLHITVSEYPGAPLRPAVVSPDGSGFELFPTDAPDTLHLGCGDWSPDGSHLVLEGFGDPPSIGGIYTASAVDGSGLERLTQGHDWVPQYAPNGSAVVFQRTVDRAGRPEVGALFIVGSDGTGLRQITPWGSALSSGSWSSDGRIVYSGPGDTLWTVAADGSDRTRIPVALTGSPSQPRWSPDGTEIVFSLDVRGQRDIFTVRADGSRLIQLTHTPGIDEWWPDWRAR